MQRRRFLTKPEKAEILSRVAERVKAGESKYDACYDIAGLYWQNVSRWLEKDADLWNIIMDEPYPYDGPLLNERNRTDLPCFDWNEAMAKLVAGCMIRPQGSMLYRYRLEGGRLLEYRKQLTSGDWYKTTEITIPEKAYETWKFEVVA
jgi:hypothetical protein